MSNRAKNFRRRTEGEVNDDKDDNGTTTTSTATTTKYSSKLTSSTTTRSTTATKPKKLLSFADDEDTEIPVTRRSSKSSSSSRLSKPSSSHKINSIKERLAPSPASLPSNVQPQAGQYTKEALLELQKNTKTLASSRPPPDRRPSVASATEPVVVLKGLVKPVLEREKENEDELEGRESVGEEGVSVQHDNETRLRLMDIRKVTGEGEGERGLGPVIPDQATINAIRAKRERLRQSRAAAPDYISLDGGSNHGEAEGLSDEEPEFQTRISMFGKKIDSGKKGVFEDVDERPPVMVRAGQLSMEVEDDDEDEEERKWEEEQFRKALGKRMDDGSSRVSGNSTMVQAVQEPRLMYPAPQVAPHAAVSAGSATVGGSIGGVQGFEVMPITQQAEIARKALQDSVGRLRETQGKTMVSLTQTDENLSTALTNIIDFENKLSAAGEKFIFMQKLRDFVSVMCDFLQHKAPYIEELEEQMQQLHEECASSNLERRAADNDDVTTEVEAAVNAAMSVFGKGGATASTIAAASRAAETAVATIKEQRLPVELDETGRDMNLKRRMDMARRAEARRRRKARSDSKRISSIANGSSYQQIEGESSTDESDDDSAAYLSHRGLLLQTAEQVFSDAAEEYSELSAVKARFERWKRNYSESYRDAYMSLSIPAIFSPYVRLELLKWDPLHEFVDFYDMKWHSLLFDYGAPVDGSDFSPDDADANLVPGLVEKIALRILHHDIAHCWDMLSTRETRNAVSATNLIISYVSASSEALKELIALICARLADAVAKLVVPTWSALVMKAVPIAARVAAYRFGVAVRLMRNICLWKDILALPVLEKLALDELLAGKILPHIRILTSDVHDAITRTERIIDSLSGVWSGPSITATRSHKLQPLVDYVLTLGKALEKKHASGISESETSGLARRLKKMLVDLNEYDEARAISRTFHLKEAL